MWTRKKLKERAKAALNRNYWKVLLVSILLMLLGCEAGGYSFSTSVVKHVDSDSSVERAENAAEDIIVVDDVEVISGTDESVAHIIGRGETELDDFGVRIDDADAIAIVIMTVTYLIVFFFILAVFIVVDIFLINPFDVGGKRFMRKSVEDVAQVKEVAFAYDHAYKNVVKVMFYRDLYTFLWTLLLVIPGS